MKIAVVSDDGLSIASHFGRARGFVIFSIENGAVVSKDWLPNSFTAHVHGLTNGQHGQHGEHDHGMHSHGPIVEALSGCEVVISRGMGRRAFDDLSQAGIKVLVTGEDDIEKSLGLFLAGQLTDQPQLHCDHHGHGQ